MILFSPHNDDETLFAAYTLLRYRPHVVVCLYPEIEDKVWGNGATAEVRCAETDAAMKVLGCSWEQWTLFSDMGYDPEALEEHMRDQFPGQPPVWAPYPEERGHHQHNEIGQICRRLFTDVRFYTTYTPSGKSIIGTPVPIEPGWAELKRKALDCYQSQINEPATQAHFSRPQDEYIIEPAARLLAAELDPADGS